MMNTHLGARRHLTGRADTPKTASDTGNPWTVSDAPARVWDMTENTVTQPLSTIEQAEDAIESVEATLAPLREFLESLKADRDAIADKPQIPALLTVSQASTYLSLSRSTLYLLIDEGLPTIKIGGSARLRTEDLSEFIAVRRSTKAA